MKAIRKRVKPPQLSHIIKQNQNDSDGSNSSTDSSVISTSSSEVIQSNNSQPECQENSIQTYKNAALNEWEEDHPLAEEKTHQKTRVFEKRRSHNTLSNVVRQKTDNISPISLENIAQDISLPAQFAKSTSSNQNNYSFDDIGSTSFPLQDLNPKLEHQSTTSLPSSIISTATKSTLLSQNIQIPASQLSLLAKIMNDIEKNSKDNELYPTLPKANNRLCVLTAIVLGIAGFMYFSM